MGSSESGFRAGVTVLLLGLSMAQSVPTHGACAAPAAAHTLTQPQYKEPATNASVMGFMESVVQSFLYTVQPNPFPEDLILQLVKDVQTIRDKEFVKKILVYEVGFLVCIAIGVLYIVLMPIIGFCLACCRCCGNCGGKMYQKQTSSIHCRRRTLYWSALITTAIILAGNICMFKSNEDLKKGVDQSTVELTKTIDNIKTFLTAVPQQIDSVLNESTRTINAVNGNLDAIGPQLGEAIQGQFRGTLDPALAAVTLLDQEANNTDVQLEKLNSSLVQLQSSMTDILIRVALVKNRINQTISKCPNCSSVTPDLQKLPVDITVTLPSLTEVRSAVDQVIQVDLKSKINETMDYFNRIPQVVTNETKDVVESSKTQLSDIKIQISEISDKIPLSALNNVLRDLERVQSDVTRYTPEVEKAERIRWAVCVALCCVVLLVVVCNLLGLCLGPMGLKAKADPTLRSCTSDCGGTFLMMGAGFSFLFGWLFMIVVLVLFLLGANIQTLVCRPWDNGQLLKFIDTPGLIPELDIGQSLGIKTKLNISDIYSDCEENEPLWTTLHLYEVVDLEDLLNVSKYTGEIEQQFADTNISLSTVTVLTPQIKALISNFSSDAATFDSTTALQQMNNISSINLNTTADKLDELADKQVNNNIERELRNQSAELRQIQSDIETIIFPQVEALNSTIKRFQSIIETINRTVEEALSGAKAAQDFLDTNTTLIVKTEARKFLDCQLDHFIVYADWANRTITQQVGLCRPVARAVDSAEIVICSHMVEALNAFWFSLGWCMMFFLPSIIFSIKLAKYYRRMDQSDTYDDHIVLHPIPRANMRYN